MNSIISYREHVRVINSCNNERQFKARPMGKDLFRKFLFVDFYFGKNVNVHYIYNMTDADYECLK